MFKNIKVGDIVATITNHDLVRLVTVMHVTKKQIHINSAFCHGGVDKYRREDGSRVDAGYPGISLTTVDDPRVVRRLANMFYNDTVASLVSYRTTIKDLEIEDLVNRLNDIKSYLDGIASIVQDPSGLVDRFL